MALCEVTYWHPNGKVSRRGQAQWVTGQRQAPRFYWYRPLDELRRRRPDYGHPNLYRWHHHPRRKRTSDGQLTQVETYEANRRIRTETYTDGKLIKVETFEHGLRTGTTNTL